MLHSKKYLAILISLVFLFTSCAKAPCPESVPEGSSAPVSPSSQRSAVSSELSAGALKLPAESSASIAASEKEALSFHSSSQGSSNEYGYYEIALRPDGSGNLFFTDFSSRQKMVLCNRPECDHHDETCSGYLPNAANIPEIAAISKNLILVYPGNPYIAEGTFPYIELRDLTGENAKTLCSFPASAQIDYHFTYTETHLYILQTTLEDAASGPKAQALKIDLRTGDTQTIAQFSCKDGEKLFFVGAAGGKLIFKQNRIDEELLGQLCTDGISTSALSMATKFNLFAIDPVSGEKTALRNWSYGETNQVITGNACFFFNEGSIDRFDPETSEMIRLVEGQEGCSPHTIEQVFFADPYLIYNIHYPSDDPSTAVIQRFICNVETLERKESHLTASYLGIEDPISILTITPEFLLVEYRIEPDSSSEKADPYSRIKKKTAILALQDFIEDQPNYIPIEDN